MLKVLAKLAGQDHL